MTKPTPAIIKDIRAALALVNKCDVYIEKRQTSVFDLKKIGIDIDHDPSPFICTNGSVILRNLLKKYGAEVYGFQSEDNPTATVQIDPQGGDHYGHDFTVLADGTIIDWWRTVYGSGKEGSEIVFVGTPEYAEYGDPAKWKRFDAWKNAGWKWAKKVPSIDEMRKRQ